MEFLKLSYINFDRYVLIIVGFCYICLIIGETLGGSTIQKVSVGVSMER